MIFNCIKFIRKREWLILLFNVVFPIFIGSLIYILFRRKSLIVFSWLSALWLDGFVDYLRELFFPFYNVFPEYVIYSLPNGLWVYSGTFLFLRIWKGSLSFYYKYFWVFLPLISSLMMEVFQYFRIIKGAFCFTDIALNLLSFFLAVTFNTIYSSEVLHEI